MFATSIKSLDILKRVISISKISRTVFGSKNKMLPVQDPAKEEPCGYYDGSWEDFCTDG